MPHKARFLGQICCLRHIYQNIELSLTPSFVGSNPATPTHEKMPLKYFNALKKKLKYIILRWMLYCYNLREIHGASNM